MNRIVGFSLLCWGFVIGFFVAAFVVEPDW